MPTRRSQGGECPSAFPLLLPGLLVGRVVPQEALNSLGWSVQCQVVCRALGGCEKASQCLFLEGQAALPGLQETVSMKCHIREQQGEWCQWEAPAPGPISVTSVDMKLLRALFSHLKVGTVSMWPSLQGSAPLLAGSSSQHLGDAYKAFPHGAVMGSLGSHRPQGHLQG